MPALSVHTQSLPERTDATPREQRANPTLRATIAAAAIVTKASALMRDLHKKLEASEADKINGAHRIWP